MKQSVELGISSANKYGETSRVGNLYEFMLPHPKVLIRPLKKILNTLTGCCFGIVEEFHSYVDPADQKTATAGLKGNSSPESPKCHGEIDGFQRRCCSAKGED